MDKRKIEKCNLQRVSGDFLRSLRKEKNLSQEQLAEVPDVSVKTVIRYENGDRAMDGVSIRKAGGRNVQARF